MSDSKGVRITVEDLDGIEPTVVIEIANTYFVLEHGDCHIDGLQIYANGTHVLTIKNANGPTAKHVQVEPQEASDGRT